MEPTLNLKLQLLNTIWNYYSSYKIEVDSMKPKKIRWVDETELIITPTARDSIRRFLFPGISEKTANRIPFLFVWVVFGDDYLFVICPLLSLPHRRSSLTGVMVSYNNSNNKGRECIHSHHYMKSFGKCQTDFLQFSWV